MAVLGMVWILGGWQKLIYGHEKMEQGKRFNYEMLGVVAVGLVFPCIALIEWVIQYFRGRAGLRYETTFDWEEIGWTWPVWGFAPAVIYYTSSLAATTYTGWTVAGGWFVFAVLIGLLWKSGFHRERRARNPLSGVLKVEEGQIGGRPEQSTVVAATTEAHATG